MRDCLLDACRGLGPLDGSQVDQLLVHWHLLLQWNTRTNLTSITDPAEAAALHYADSLQGLPHLHGDSIVDLGSGAGFPGLVLAVMRPQWHVTLLEPRQKRASFLQVAVAAMRLRHVSVLCARMQDGPDRPYATAVTRATFADVADLGVASAWLAPGGVLLAYRAMQSEPLPAAARVVSHSYVVQGRDRQIDAWTFP